MVKYVFYYKEFFWFLVYFKYDFRNVLFIRKIIIVYYLIKVVYVVKFVLDNMKKKIGKFDEEIFCEVLKWYKFIYFNVLNFRGK